METIPEQEGNPDFKEIKDPLLKKNPKITNKIPIISGFWNDGQEANKKPLPQKADPEDWKPKQPLLQLIRANNDTQWFEGVKEGLLKITRTDGKIAVINLERHRQLSMDWGNDHLRYWCAYEKEAATYPTEILHDSAMHWQNIEEIISNRKNLAASTINSISNLAWQLIIGIALLLIVLGVVLPMFGVNVFEQKKTNTNTTDLNQATNAAPEINYNTSNIQLNDIGERNEETNYHTKWQTLY